MMKKLPMDEVHIQRRDGAHGTIGTQFRITRRPPTDYHVPDGNAGNQNEEGKRNELAIF